MPVETRSMKRRREQRHDAIPIQPPDAKKTTAKRRRKAPIKDTTARNETETKPGRYNDVGTWVNVDSIPTSLFEAPKYDFHVSNKLTTTATTHTTTTDNVNFMKHENVLRVAIWNYHYNSQMNEANKLVTRDW
jgi:hypothetical protein